MDCNPQASSLHGILQARILECVAISFSRGLPDPEIEPGSPALQADSLLLSHWGKTICTLHRLFILILLDSKPSELAM